MRRHLLMVLALAVASAALPARAQTCTPFDDVGADDPFCPGIQWLLNRGVTLGCTATQYCPGQFVRRDQMAAFLNRLADKTVFQQGGNAFGGPGVLGTSEFQPLDIRVGGSRVMRYEPSSNTPNVIGGKAANSVAPFVFGATISGGGSTNLPNRVTDDFGTVAGGQGNLAGDAAGTVADVPGATVSGGLGNTASSSYSVVAGGANNRASGDRSTVAGGGNNVASGARSTVAGGTDNEASNGLSTVVGGGNNLASGQLSTVAGGLNNVASGQLSFAAGHNARATGDGSFIWADSRSQVFEFLDDNLFGVRATGGVNFTTAVNAAGLGTNLCRLDPGQVGWICNSDRDGKENFEPANGEEILERLAAMPMYSYTLKGADPAPRQLGPTAQDFHAAFRLGTDAKTIATNNMHGVALAALQGLHAKVAAQAREIAELRRVVSHLLGTRDVSPDAR